MSRAELEASLEVSLKSPLFLVTFHPETTGSVDVVEQTQELLKALDQFSEATVVMTRPNADARSKEIESLLTAFCERGSSHIFTSLGQQRYLSLLKLANVVVGNSSSGLIEAAAVQTPTVNIGDRQKGRLRGESVLDCHSCSESISLAIEKSLDSQWLDSLGGMSSPYGDGEASGRICKIIEEVSLEGLTKKRFYDIP